MYRRLTVYPEVVRNIHEWADSAKGRLSPAAAVLRLADSHGLVRGSSWCPGLVGDNAPVTPVQPSGLSLDSLAGISTPGDLARQAGAGTFAHLELVRLSREMAGCSFQ